MEFGINAEFWAIVALIIFIGVVLYIRVPKMLNSTLDARIKTIEAELTSAAQLREEAKKLLASYAN